LNNAEKRTIGQIRLSRISLSIETVKLENLSRSSFIPQSHTGTRTKPVLHQRALRVLYSVRPSASLILDIGSN